MSLLVADARALAARYENLKAFGLASVMVTQLADRVEELEREVEELRKNEEPMPDVRTQRIWVSEDRCTLLTMWYATHWDDDPASVTVAFRDDPSHTWGPPITLTEEKT